MSTPTLRIGLTAGQAELMKPVLAKDVSTPKLTPEALEARSALRAVTVFI